MNRNEAVALANSVVAQLAKIMGAEQIESERLRGISTKPPVRVEPVRWGYGHEWRVKIVCQGEGWGNEISSVRKKWDADSLSDFAIKLREFQVRENERMAKRRDRDALADDLDRFVLSLTDRHGRPVQAYPEVGTQVKGHVRSDVLTSSVEMIVNLRMESEADRERLRRIVRMLADEELMLPEIEPATYIAFIERLIAEHGAHAVAVGFGMEVAQLHDALRQWREMPPAQWVPHVESTLNGYRFTRGMDVTGQEVRNSLVALHRERLRDGAHA